MSDQPETFPTEADILEVIFAMFLVTGVHAVRWDPVRDLGVVELETPTKPFHMGIKPEAIEELQFALEKMKELRPNLTKQ